MHATIAPIASTTTTLAGALWRERTDTRLVRGAILAVTGAAVLTASARLQIPSWPVPMTLQTLAVLVLGMAYGRNLASATVMLYLGAGAAGLPVFAGTPERGLGLAYMFGPTGGFLLGFLAAAPLLGWLAERGFDKGFARTLFAMTLGHVLIFAFGAAWLVATLGSTAVLTALTPLVVATIVKTLLGALLLPSAWSIVRRFQR